MLSHCGVKLMVLGKFGKYSMSYLRGYGRSRIALKKSYTMYN